MRNCIIVCAVVLALASGAIGQDQGFHYGFKLGLVRADIHMGNRGHEHYVNDKYLIWFHDFVEMTSYNFGGFVSYDFTGRVQARVEPGYISKGAGFQVSPSKLSLTYINVPVLLRYNLSSRIGLLVGPEFSLPLGATLHDEGRKIDMGDQYDNGIETSLCIGADFRANKVYSFGLRYSHGKSVVSVTNWYDFEGSHLIGVDEYNHYVTAYIDIRVM